MTKPKVIGYIPLLYGAEYLEACLRSILPHVDKLIIVYTPHGSQGHSTKIPCPESENQLRDIALATESAMLGAGEITNGKIEWHSTTGFPTEGQHRDYILKYAKGYDLVFTLDADEVVEPLDVEKALMEAWALPVRHVALKGFINFWRSFNFVCLDGFLPYRIVNLKNHNGHGVVDCRVYHFSTAQKEETVRYKWNVSGHASELKPGWIDNTWLRWTPENQFGDLHPVSIGLWNAVPFDRQTLPEMLKSHPNFEKSVI